VFAPDTPSRRTVRHRIEKEMYRALQRGDLPVHFTPHSLRHTYASILLSVVEAPISYVQRQLGHANIRQTVEVYGRWSSARQAVRGRPEALATNGNNNGGAGELTMRFYVRRPRSKKQPHLVPPGVG